MAVGFQVDKSVIDTAAGNTARTIASWAATTIQLQQELARLTQDELVALGYTADDVALLKSAINDANTLALIYLGQQAQTTAYDFRTFLGRISGFNL